VQEKDVTAICFIIDQITVTVQYNTQAGIVRWYSAGYFEYINNRSEERAYHIFFSAHLLYCKGPGNSVHTIHINGVHR